MEKFNPIATFTALARIYLIVSVAILLLSSIIFDIFVANTAYSDDVSAHFFWGYVLRWGGYSFVALLVTQLLGITQLRKGILIISFAAWTLSLYNLHIIEKNDFLPDYPHYEKFKDFPRPTIKDKRFWLGLLP